VEKGRIIKGRLQRLIEGIKKANYEDCDKEYIARRVEERINELQQRGVNYVDRFVQKLLDRIGDKEAYFDILMEGRFAIILARNNFLDIEIEYTQKGPDLKARWNGKTVYFEVTRRHAAEDEWAVEGASFVSSDKTENVISKIRAKHRQLQSGEVNIVVIWSDTVRLGYLELEEAFQYIQLEIQQEPELYKDLSGILFTEGGGVSPTRLTPFQLFKNYKASNPLGTRLARKLESLYERNPKQLQGEFEELTAALERIKSKR